MLTANRHQFATALLFNEMFGYEHFQRSEVNSYPSGYLLDIERKIRMQRDLCRTDWVIVDHSLPEPWRLVEAPV